MEETFVFVQEDHLVQLGIEASKEICVVQFCRGDGSFHHLVDHFLGSPSCMLLLGYLQGVFQGIQY